MEKVKDNRNGIMYAFTAFFWWGLFPLYWKLLSGISSVEILANRIIWSFVLTFLLIILRGEFGKFKAMIKERKNGFKPFFRLCVYQSKLGFLYICREFWKDTGSELGAVSHTAYDGSLGYCHI